MNPYEALAREKKAGKLAALLIANGCSSVGAAGIDHEHRRIAARLVGVSEPSDKTWDRVVRIIEEREEADDQTRKEVA